MFKNAHFYKIEDSMKLNLIDIELALSGRITREIGMMEMSSDGWESADGNIQLCRMISGNRVTICMRRDDKVLPASAVREAVSERAKQVETESGRPVVRKERNDIKDQVLQELLPRALVKTTRTLAYLSLDQKWMVIDASSASKAESLIELLRKTLGTLNVVLPTTEKALESSMTKWMMDDTALPEVFAITDKCELRSRLESAGIIRCQNADLSSDEIKAHVSTGYRVTKLGLNWRDQIVFTLHDDLSLHSLKFDAALINEAADVADDEHSRFEADMTIMTDTLDTMINELMAALS